MLWKTSNAFRRLSTWADDMAENLASVAGRQSLLRWPLLRFGTAPMLAANGTSGMQSTLPVGLSRAFQPHAPIAAGGITSPSLRWARESSATRTAKPVHCVSVEPLPEKQTVYCITVPETGCFALKGGMIVANCGDSVRYACMSRPYNPPVPKPPPGPRFLDQMTADEAFFPNKQQQKPRARV
jgi:hypothetical protein